MPAGDLTKLEPGTVLQERYEIIEFLNEGGMGSLYKGKHLEIEREVAVKLLKADPDEDEGSYKRFRLEAKIAGSLNHSNLTSVYDFGQTEDGCPFLVMDFLHGETLEERLKKVGRLEIPDAVSIFLQICDGLKHAHDKELIHRDLKPSNVMLVKEGSKDLVKVMDFGIAKALNTRATQNLTRTGEIFGSPLYMSPEQCLSQPLDARSDIYSLGCMLYEALTGNPPLMGDGPLQTMYKHMNDSAPPICQEYPDLLIPDDLEELVFKCMEKNPYDRFQSIEELSRALRNIMSVSIGRKDSPAKASGDTTTKQPAGSDPEKKPPVALIACIAVAIIVSVFAYISWQQAGTGERMATDTSGPPGKDTPDIGTVPILATEAEAPAVPATTAQTAHKKPETKAETGSKQTKSTSESKSDALEKAIKESPKPLLLAQAPSVAPAVATSSSHPHIATRARKASAFSGASINTPEPELNATEKMLKRLRETTVPSLKLNVDKLTDCNITWNVDWDSFVVNPNAAANLEYQGLFVIRQALSDICKDKIGKNAIKGSIRAINIKNVDSKADKSITFANGVLNIKGAWADGWNGYPSSDAIKKVVENGL